jgi:hypothetical protein
MVLPSQNGFPNVSSRNLADSNPTSDLLITDSWKAWDAYRQSILPPGLSHYCIAPLCVSPSHQNRSIGSALLSHLTQIADEKSLPIYLDASKAGEGLYRKKGWICWGDAGREFAPMVRWGKAEVPKGEWDKAYERNVSQTMIFDRAEISRADLELVVMSDLLGNDCRH